MIINNQELWVIVNEDGEPADNLTYTNKEEVEKIFSEYYNDNGHEIMTLEYYIINLIG